MSRPRWILPVALSAAAIALVAGVIALPALTTLAERIALSGTPSGAPPAAAPAPEESEPALPALDPAVQAQIDYVLAYWSDYNVEQYGVLEGNDCVNFASQSLLERGWQMDEDWQTSGTGSDFDYTSAWVSSTAFMEYLEESGRASALTDQQRSEVKIGDIVQFDWDNSGDRDHTGVVTAITGSGDDITISFAGHTADSDFRSVDDAITIDHPGGTAYYWSIPAA